LPQGKGAVSLRPSFAVRKFRKELILFSLGGKWKKPLRYFKKEREISDSASADLLENDGARRHFS
jgi:hypothetical protein